MATVSEIKTLLRTAATRLQKAQAKFEANAEVSRKDITSLLNREMQLRSSMNQKDEVDQEKLLNVARLKGEKLIADDEASNVMEVLERYCDVLIEGRLSERASELNEDDLEAVSGIIAAASRIDSAELVSLSLSLAHRYQDLTPEYVLRTHIPPKFAEYLTPVRPLQSVVDETLVSIAQTHGLGNWHPPQLLLDDRRQELITLLDTTSWISIIDEPRLRHLASHGIPDTPAWLRSRAWAVLLGTLSLDKSQWTTKKEREKSDYVSLASQVLGGLANQGPPTSPSSNQDRTIQQFGKDVESLPLSIRHALADVHSSQPQEVDFGQVIPQGDIVSLRISLLKGRSKSPDIQPDSAIPSITLDNPPRSPSAASFNDPNSQSTVLLPSSQNLNRSTAYDDLLLRMLYIHSSIHASHALAMGPSPALAAIFATVLAVSLAAHNATVGKLSEAEYIASILSVEAEVFWMVEAIVGRVMELLEPDEEAENWTTKFSRMTHWADRDLWQDLSKKGLDPALPYYSYRWIPTLFTHALPFHVLLPVWDSLFSATYLSQHSDQHRRPPQSNFVYTLGTAMLIRARAALFQSDPRSPASAVSPTGSLAAFWKRQTGAPEIQLPHSPSAYSPVGSPKTPLSPTLGAVPSHLPAAHSSGHMTPATASNVFLVSVKLLQDYDVESLGGIDRLLDTTLSLWKKWNREGGEGIFISVPATQTIMRTPEPRAREDIPPPSTNGGMFGGLTKIGAMAWKGITNEVEDDAASSSPPEEDAPIRPATKHIATPEVTVTSPISTGSSSGLFSSFSGGFGSRLTETVWKGVTNQVDTPITSPEVSPAPSSAASPILRAHDEAAPPLEKERTLDAKGSSWAGDAPTTWAVGYADKWKDSDTAAALLRTGTNLRVKAMDAWSRKSGQNIEVQGDGIGQASAPKRPESMEMEKTASVTGENASPATSSRGSWGDMFAKRGSLAFMGSWKGDPKRQAESGPETATSWESGSSKHSSYSPPPKPAHFRVGRDSVYGSTTSGTSVDLSHLPTSPTNDSDSASKNPLQAALAALTTKTPEPPKKGPKPLLLSSTSLITPSGSRSTLHSRTPSRTPSRRPSPNPTPRIGDRTSLPALSNEDATTPGASTVVSLRRGPLTNPRTAGYPRPGMERSHSSQSSLSSVPVGGRAYSVDLPADYVEKRLRTQRSTSSRGGFLVDHGDDGNGVGTVERVQLRDEGFQSSDASGSREASPYRGRRYTDADTVSETRKRPAPIPIDSLPSTIPELTVITPRSGDKFMITSPNLMSDEDWKISQAQVAKPLVIETNDAPKEAGARLTRSRTPIRRKVSGSTDERKGRSSRLTPSRSGSEEGAKADVEDLEDAYGGVY